MLTKLITAVLLMALLVSFSVYMVLSKAGKSEDERHDSFSPENQIDSGTQFRYNNIPKKVNDVFHNDIASNDLLQGEYNLTEYQEYTIHQNDLRTNLIGEKEKSNLINTNEKQDEIQDQGSLLKSVKYDSTCNQDCATGDVSQSPMRLDADNSIDTELYQFENKTINNEEKTSLIDSQSSLNEETNDKYCKSLNKGIKIYDREKNRITAYKTRNPFSINLYETKFAFAMINVSISQMLTYDVTKKELTIRLNSPIKLNINIFGIACIESSNCSHTRLLKNGITGNPLSDCILDSLNKNHHKPFNLQTTCLQPTKDNVCKPCTLVYSNVYNDLTLLNGGCADLRVNIGNIGIESTETFMFRLDFTCFAEILKDLNSFDTNQTTNHLKNCFYLRDKNLRKYLDVVVNSRPKGLTDVSNDNEHDNPYIYNENILSIDKYNLHLPTIPEYDTLGSESFARISTAILTTNQEKPFEQAVTNLTTPYTYEITIKDLDRTLIPPQSSVKNVSKEINFDEEDEALEEFLQLEKMIEDDFNNCLQDENVNLKEVFFDPHFKNTNGLSDHNSHKDYNINSTNYSRSTKEKMRCNYYKCKHCSCNKIVVNNLFTIAEEDSGDIELEAAASNFFTKNELCDASY